MCKNTTSGGPMQMHDGRALKDWRRSCSMGRADAARHFGMTYPTYCRIEAGYPPTLERANRICTRTNGAVRYRDLWPMFNPEMA